MIELKQIKNAYLKMQQIQAFSSIKTKITNPKSYEVIPIKIYFLPKKEFFTNTTFSFSIEGLTQDAVCDIMNL